MDDNQRSKIMRAEKVVVYLTDNATALADHADVTDDKAAIEAKIDEANANDTKATADTTGITETKKDESAEMVESSMKLVAFLKKYARNINDKVLFNLIDFKRSELQGKDDNKRRNAAKFLSDEADKDGVMDALGAFTPKAYLPADLTAHKLNVTQYDGLIARPLQERSIKTAYTKAVARNIIELDDIIDNLRIEMGIVEFFDKTLFDAFEAAAMIDDAPSHSETHFTGSIDPNGQKKITDIIYDPADEVRIQNTGTTMLQLSFKNEDGETVGAAIEVATGTTITHTFEDIAPEGHELWLQNMSADTGGNYIINLL